MTRRSSLHPAVHAPAVELDRTEYDAHGPNAANLILTALARKSFQLETPAFICANHPDQVTTADDLLNGSVRAARALVAKHHVQKGDRIVILAPNQVRWPVTLMAGMLAGAVMVLVNPILTPQEAMGQIKCAQGSVKAVVTVAAMAKLAQLIASQVEAADGQGPIIINLDGATTVVDSQAHFCIDDLMAFADESIKLPQVSESDIAAVCFSSGTTGKHKAAALTHANVASAVLQVAQHEYAAMHRASDVMDAVLPWYHIFGLVVNMMQSIYLGTKVVLSAELRFDLVAWLQLVQDHKVTISHLVPPILVGIAKHPIVDKFDLSTLRSITVGACPLDAQLHAMVVKRFKNLRVCQGFGLTEASPAVSFLTYKESADPNTYGSVGSLVPSVYALLISTETDPTIDSDSSIIPITTPNTPGELLVSGPNVIPGYIGNNQADATTFVEWQGRRWLRTGDVAIIRDDQRFVVVDRIKELIKYNGYQVAPAELEALLITHPKVAQAAVVGKPDQEHGELPVAFVSLKAVGDDADEEAIASEVRAFVDAQVAPYRRLRGGVQVVDMIPVSPTGKLLRRVLKERLVQAANK